MADAALDRRLLGAAIRLGSGALGTTRPNPAVGAILVRDGKVLGRGRTAPGGRPHAERIALSAAGEAARATAYISLEPCAHHGRTPPCADALVAAGVTRVVATLADPDPRVGGKGFDRLRAAGVAVATGLLEAEARRAQTGHFARIGRGRPFVLLKLAVSADEAIGRTGEGRVAVTGEIATRHVQALRSRFDAILVGRGTIEADDPELTCRLPGLEHRSPLRIVLDSDSRLGPERRVFGGSVPTWIITADTEEAAGPIRRLKAPRRAAGGLDIRAALARLAGEGITRLMVEGGARVARAFIEADAADEVMLFRSRVVLGGEAVPALAGLPLSNIEGSDRFRRIERRMFGADRMTRYERMR